MQTPYIRLRQGQGGVFHLPFHTPLFDMSVENIATFGCQTCVCIYIPLGDTRHFVAHMAGCRINAPNLAAMWQVEGALLDFFRAAVREKLQRIVIEHPLNEDMRKRAKIICPRQNFEGLETWSKHIIDIACEVFGLERWRAYEPGPHGFLINVNTPYVDQTYLRWRRESMEVWRFSEQEYDEAAYRGAVERKPEDFDFVECEMVQNGEMWDLVYDTLAYNKGWHWAKGKHVRNKGLQSTDQ